jgi:hypothetical protein
MLRKLERPLCLGFWGSLRGCLVVRADMPSLPNKRF